VTGSAPAGTVTVAAIGQPGKTAGRAAKAEARGAKGTSLNVTYGG